MQVVGDLSKELEKHSTIRVAEAKRNEMLKDALRKGFERYQRTEEDFNKKMQECELALASFQKNRSLLKKKKKTSAASAAVHMAGDTSAQADTASAQSSSAADEAPVASQDSTQEGSVVKPVSDGLSEDTAQLQAKGPGCDSDEEEGEEEGEEEAEDEEFKTEIEAEKTRTEAAKQRIMTQIVAEKELRSQLAEYADHFERFQESLNRSNESFGGFKTRMEEMTLLIRNLERDNKSLEDKEKKSADVLETMKAENSALNAGINRGQQQCSSLESLIGKLESDNEAQKKELQARLLSEDGVGSNIAVI